MKLITVAALALNQTPLDWDGNLKNIREAIEAARSANAQLVCLPELCITGYGCEDMFLAPDTYNTALNILFRDIAPLTSGIAVMVGLPMQVQGALYNVAAFIFDGKVLGFTAKQHLAGDGIHYEPRWFKAWPSDILVQIQTPQGELPFGDVYYDLSGVRVGFEICEDAWVAGRPGNVLAQCGVDIILNPSASHFAFGKHDIRKRFVIEGSRAFNCAYVYANLLGNESGRSIFDGDTMIASNGKLLASGRRFSFRNFVLCTSQIDVERIRMAKASSASFMADPTAGEGNRIDYDVSWKSELPSKLSSSIEAETWENNKKCYRFEEFTRAETLGLWDYMRKSRSKGFVLSLSGGADSAACAVLVHCMVKFVLLELNIDEIVKRLSYFPEITALRGEVDFRERMMRRLLLCVYQASSNSSDVTRNAAQTVAETIHAEFCAVDISSLIASYTQLAETAIGRSLTWGDDDITLQNIQARVRAPGVWMFANIRNALLISTSNRSEAAVGYATMDGDTSGGISPLAGIDKVFIRKWLIWMEKVGPSYANDERENLPSLSCINIQQPTAELRPQERAQTDEDDLMPYPVLDVIERYAIRDKIGPVDIWQLTQRDFPQYSASVLGNWVIRFFTLWCRNQWKRERYAPSFHLDDENLDPKTWCRFPILNGGFSNELQQLRDAIANLAIPKNP